MEIAELLDSHTDVGKKMNLAATMQQGARMLTNELNYRQEAQNTRRIKRNLAEFPEIYIPEVIDDYTTTRVMTLESLPGKKVSKIAPIELLDHDYAGLAGVLTRAYLKQICVDGFWHSDPHPGNVFIHEAQLLLLDFGMVNRITQELQDEIIKLLLGITENRGQDVADICIRIGQTQDGFQRDKFFRDVSELVANYHDADLRQVNTGQLIFNVISVANADEVQVPSELAILAKTLLHLDGITRKLDPQFNPREAIRDYAETLMTQKVIQKFQPRNFYTPLLDLNELLLTLPKKLRDLVQQSSTGNLTFKVRIDQAEDFLTGMQRIANRIAVGVVIAALVIGSALLMRIPTQFTFFGYPALAILGFVGASSLGFYLVVSSLLHDRRDRLKAKTKLRS
ncbi:MAG TPA: AarF/UbiB family protein, partial [Thermoanaerobaculia bacterium]